MTTQGALGAEDGVEIVGQTALLTLMTEQEVYEEASAAANKAVDERIRDQVIMRGNEEGLWSNGYRYGWIAALEAHGHVKKDEVRNLHGGE